MSRPADFSKWQRQIEALARHFEQDLINNPRIFKYYKDIVRANQAVDVPGAHFHRWVERNHFYALLAALRKVFTKTDRNEISLLKIINELLGSGSLITRQKYPELIGFTNRGLGAEAVLASAYQDFFSDDGKLNQQKLNEDREYLQNTLRPLIKFIDELVLHVQKNPKAATPSEAELKQAIEKLSVMLYEYRLFLTGKGVQWVEDDFDWTSIFTVPWR